MPLPLSCLAISGNVPIRRKFRRDAGGKRPVSTGPTVLFQPGPVGRGRTAPEATGATPNNDGIRPQCRRQQMSQLRFGVSRERWEDRAAPIPRARNPLRIRPMVAYWAMIAGVTLPNGITSVGMPRWRSSKSDIPPKSGWAQDFQLLFSSHVLPGGVEHAIIRREDVLFPVHLSH